jgi:tetratricopeptide (TPR) repeat protein
MAVGYGVAQRATGAAQQFQQAVIAHRQGRLPEAQRLLRAVVKAAPEHFDSLYLLGMVETQLGHAEDAQKWLRKAVYQRPNAAPAQSSLGTALLACGRRDDAIARYQKALALDPTNLEANANLGTIMQGLGRHEEAAEYCRRALAAGPDLAGLHGNLANALRALDRREEALAHAKKAVELQPGSAEIKNNLGRMLQALGRFEEAMAQYQTAAAARPDFAEAQVNLLLCRADALLQAGELEASTAVLQDGLRHLLTAPPPAAVASPAADDAAPGAALLLDALRAAAAHLAEQGIDAFLIGGTLLGAMREGDFLPSEKDLDFGLPVGIDFARVEAAFAGDPLFARAPRPEQQQVLASWRFRGRVGIDFFRFFEEGERVWCGLVVGSDVLRWVHRRFAPTPFRWHDTDLLVPDDADRFLTECYGDWRTPDPNFGMFAAPNLKGGYSPLARRVAYADIFAAAIRNQPQRARHLCEQALHLDPGDGLLAQLRERFAVSAAQKPRGGG